MDHEGGALMNKINTLLKEIPYKTILGDHFASSIYVYVVNLKLILNVNFNCKKII